VRASCLVVSRRHWRTDGRAVSPGEVLEETDAERLPDPSAARGGGPLRFPRPAAIDGLFESVERNLERYIEGDFETMNLEEDAPEAPDARLLSGPLSRLRPEQGGGNDAVNAALVFDALPGLTPRLARSEGLWVWLCHGPCLAFARERWIREGQSKAEIAKDVRRRFFAREDGDRAFTRNNAVASLWWRAHIASRYPRADMRRSLEILLTRTDLRSALLERPTTARDPRVFSALMDVVFSRHEADEKSPFFSRRNPYRLWSKKVNRLGKERTLDVLPEPELRALFERLASEAEAEAEPRPKSAAPAKRAAAPKRKAARGKAAAKKATPKRKAAAKKAAAKRAAPKGKGGRRRLL